MLESLSLRNFQKHKKLLIQFSPHVTTIIGRNDKGKSAILRALRLVCLNQPAGIAYIRRGSKTTKITLRVDGHRIQRVRSRRRNQYYLQRRNKSGNDRPLNAFGKGKVPDPISKILNIGPDNFQGQLDPPFWFLESAGSISKNLNRIINLEIIHKTLENVAKKLRRENTEQEITRQRLAETKLALAKLKWAEEMDTDLVGLEKAKDRHTTLAIKRARLQGIVQGIRESRKDRIGRQRAVREGREVVRTGESFVSVRRKGRTLAGLVDRIKKARSLAQIKVPEMGDVEAAYVDMHKSAEDRRALEHIVTQLREAKKCREIKQRELSKLQERLLKLTKKRCPMCGAKLKMGHFHPSSQSQSQTFTLEKRHQQQGRRKKIGGKSNDVPF
jgi:hypothetical protein